MSESELCLESAVSSDAHQAPVLIAALARSAARQPGAVAVRDANAELSYAQLERRSNQLARHLAEQGVRPGGLVAVSLERSAEMLVALLGVLKAGAAYVPLDPAFPVDRRRFMLEDCGATAALFEAGTADAIPASVAIRVAIDADASAIAAVSDAAPAALPGSGDLAYIIYTSGSTGRPKGVEVAHSALASFLASVARRPGLAKDDTLVAVTTLSFDIAGLELYLPLVIGATVMVASRETANDGVLLRDLLKRCGSKVMQATPATWRMLLQAGWEGGDDFRVLCGGEALPAALARDLLPRCAQLWNLYGPTEATIWSTVARIDDPNAPISIGTALDNGFIVLLDEQMNPVADGAEGEICIGGAGLAVGYHKRDELTADRFVSRPGVADGARLYRTGDLGRQLPDGSLVHLGRLDFQVKVRGFRIELGEIEAVLERHDDVEQAAVVTHEDGPGDQRLVAYVVPATGGQPPTVPALRAACEERMPGYMVPSLFQILDAFPLTPNGKLDRNALPAPTADRGNLEQEYVAPASDDELKLAGAWKEVLRTDQVGTQDSFFELGGDSLKVAQIVTRVRELFGVNVPLKALFDGPTIAGMLASIAAAPKVDSEGADKPIVPVSRDQRIPLTFSQERVWFTHKLNPKNLAYNFHASLRFKGKLNIDALERSLSEVVRRHEGYRTDYPAGEDGRPHQVVRPAEAVELPVIDFSHRQGEAREAAVQKWMDDTFAYHFDLAKQPLVKWWLLRYGDDEADLIHMEHHLVHDGWSFNMFLIELVELYRAFAAGEPSPLPELEVQFADFAAWQHAWAEGPEAARQLEYWKKQLDGMAPLFELPVARPRPAAQSFRGTALRPEVPAKLLNELRALSTHERSSLFMTMLTAYVVLLHRYSGAQEVPVGTFFANRRNQSSEPLIGMILNNTVIRSQLSGDPSIRELMRTTRDLVLDAGNHQDVPFNRVVEAVAPQRDPGFNPLFQFMFSFHDEPMPERTLDGLDVRVKPVLSNGSAKFDLGVIGIPHSSQQLGLQQGAPDDGMTMIWEHNTDVYPTATIARMVEHYLGLLAQFVANPDQKLSALEMLDAGEREQMLGAWNTTAADYPRDEPVHEQFAAVAAQRPDAPAVLADDATLTHGQLDRKANQLAQRLRQLGVRDGERVGVSMDRSADMLMALLAVLKAGGTYVPIDPHFPTDRKRYMVQDAGLKLAVVDDAGRADLEAAGVETLDANAGSGLAEDAPSREAFSPERAAYVIYTSGSTGKPKGVAVPHRALANFLHAMRSEPGLGPDDRLLAVTTLSFDIAGLELYLPLLAGACVVIASRETATNPLALIEALDRHDITVMQATPATWRMLVDGGWQGRASMRALCGGERVPRALAEALLPRVAEVWNLYGPTETTIWSTAAKVESGEGPVPIGRPIANTRAYVLDAHRQLVPPGVPGELHIGGDGVALGYLGRDDLTAERFIADPFVDGATIYNTGDLARHHADGSLEILGRTDDQVKLRGFRIELGEIEAVLAAHPGVAQAVAMVREDVAGDERLAAYVVPAVTPAPQTAALLGAARETLPDYMVPSALVVLPSLPLTPNGKIDRRALPVPKGTRGDDAESYLAPRTPTEKALAGVWEEVIGSSPIGVRDDFFELGGHSLLAMQLMAKIKQQLGHDTSLAALFHGRTIEALAAEIGADEATETAAAPAAPAAVAAASAAAGGGFTALRPVRAEGTAPPFFAGGSHPKYGDVSRVLGADQPFYQFDVYALQAHRQGQPFRTIEPMAEQFVAELRGVQPSGPYSLGGGCEAAIVAFEAALQLQRAGEQVDHLVMWLAPPLEAWKMSLRQSVPARMMRQAKNLLAGSSLGSLSAEERRQFLTHQKLEYGLFRAIDRYRPGAKFDGHITLVRTDRGSNSSHEKLDAQWRALATGGVSSTVLPGDHETWLNDAGEGFGRVLAEVLK